MVIAFRWNEIVTKNDKKSLIKCWVRFGSLNGSCRSFNGLRFCFIFFNL